MNQIKIKTHDKHMIVQSLHRSITGIRSDSTKADAAGYPEAARTLTELSKDLDRLCALIDSSSSIDLNFE